MIVVLVMDRELAELLAVKFAATVRTDPRKHLERLLPIGLLQLSLSAPCHASLGVKATFSASCYMSCVQGQENIRIAGLTQPACFASAHQVVIAPATLSR